MAATSSSTHRTTSSKKKTTTSNRRRRVTETNGTAPTSRNGKAPEKPRSVLPPAQICHLATYCNVVHGTKIGGVHIFEIHDRTIRHWWGDAPCQNMDIGDLPPNLDSIDIFEDEAPPGTYIGTLAAIAELDAIQQRKWEVGDEIVAAVHRLIGTPESGVAS